MLQLLANLGFNRVSLGVQDFDETVQLAVNRLQPADTVARVHDAARELGFRSINFDLIYGLPKQTLESFGATLDRVAAMRPDRLAVYGYAHMPHVFKAQRQIRSAELPNAAARLALLQLAIDKLGSAGYTYIGMDHFALPTDSLALAQQNGSLHRSFQGYTTHANRDLVNLGVSAIGQVGNLYIQNYKSLQDYQGAIARGALPSHRGVRMTEDDMAAQGRHPPDHVLRRRRYGGRRTPARRSLRGAFRRRTRSGCTPWQADGLVHVRDRRIDLTPAGRLLMRTVATAFDAYAAAPRAARMSRMI